ncbi:hypothetical protein [Cyclobacterium amurskyense]|uniref:Uncharacterized protein n=1 Tax=Cyclobacterium amurskyense TaxID=320787 RepID=A0A0H4PHB3_9BACT|nr:hypothetical protein [Cyclobacterium amurskyense]AKP52435.1 hypothetical protein CA2015_3033 [Cyclobacterium amurskyense]
MIFFNYLFYLIIFLGFFIPTNSNFYIPLPGVLLKFNELAFLLLPLFNLLSYSTNKAINRNKQLKIFILFFVLIIFFVEFIIKSVAFQQSFGDSFKSIRIGLPLISSLVILYSGLNANVRIIWKLFLISIGFSIIISIVSLVIPLPIYYGLEEGIDVLSSTRGRLVNSNASFGVIGLYLLFKGKGLWYNSSKLVTFVSILSVIALIMTFNRTYLTILVLEFCYLSYKTFSKKNFLKIVLFPILFFISGLIAYNSSDIIQNQIDRRILSIVFQETSLTESTIENNRDVIYEGINNNISQGYWLFGLPLEIPIFTTVRGNVYMELAITDTSIVNVVLRFGVFPLILLILIFFKLYKLDFNNCFQVTFFFFLIASLNVDSLFGQNSIFFLLLMFIITNFYFNENSIHSKN